MSPILPAFGMILTAVVDSSTFINFREVLLIEGTKKFDLYSSGSNKIGDQGNLDDITNWRETNFEYYGGLSKTSEVVLFSPGVILLFVIVFLIIILTYQLIFYALVNNEICKFTAKTAVPGKKRLITP